jgi:formylglycine-generating enzyme required for sulfatase activity
MNDRTRLVAIIAVPLLSLMLYYFLSVLFGADNMLWAAGTFLASLDRVLGILVFLPRWASWGILLFLLAAGARFLLWENDKVSEGQRVAVVVTAAVLLLLAAVVPPLLGAGNSEKGAWWRPETHRPAGTERVFDDISFVWVPAGHYILGSPVTEPKRNLDEVQQEVRFTRGFWVSRYEITVDQYIKAVGRNPEGMVADFDQPKLPATGVSYGEALNFVKKLTENGHAKYRLPSENEWEYACRAGTTTPWSLDGDAAQLPEYAWYNINAEQKPRPVGTRKPNLWEIHDMHGNAAEWCQSSGEPGKEVAYRYRGGNWMSDAAQCRCAARGIFLPNQTHLLQFMGLRVVREP